jgi:hypothetical protein
MRLSAALLALALALGCGGPALAPSHVSLALDFSANALLQLFVLEEATHSCAGLLGGAPPGTDPTDARSARALNAGGTVTFEVDDLPAEVPLLFYARAVEGGATLADDCVDGVVIPAGGEVTVALQVREAE